MEKTWAVIKDGRVTNLVCATSDLHVTHGGDAWIDLTDVEPRPDKGWTYADGVFTPPVVEEEE